MWQAVKDYWYVPALAFGVLLGWIFWSKWTNTPTVPPVEKILKEVAAIGAARETREIAQREGNEEAKKHVADKYAEKRKRLDAEGKLKEKELEDDPVALAKYLDGLDDATDDI